MVDLIKRFKWWLFGIIFLGGFVALVERWRGSREHSQDSVIFAASSKYGVDPALVKAVIWRESWFDPDAKGTSGEVGLMQIMNATASDWATAQRKQAFTHHQLFDPALNIDCGAWYLGKLLTRYRGTDNPVVYALAAYNAGPTRIKNWSKGTGISNSVEFLRRMDFPGTKKYVKSVTERYQHYRKTFPARSARTSITAPIHGELACSAERDQLCLPPRSVIVRPTMEATRPPMSIQTALSVGEPVKNRETSELKELVALMPMIMSATPPTSRARETILFIRGFQ